MKHKSTPCSILVLLLTLIPVISSCTTPTPTATTETTTPPPVTTTTPPLTVVAGIDGGLVYLSHCAACHGIARQGVTNVGPAVVPANLTSMTDAALAAFAVSHLKIKTGVDLVPAQANNLAIYMKTP